MSDPIIIVPYQDAWSEEFRQIGSRIREALGDTAVRIDHIGSTSVPGLAAKPVIDIQISVPSLDPLHTYKPGLEAIGFVHRAGNPDLTKRYFRETPGSRRTHIHVRERGSWPEQSALLFRDYLRQSPEDCEKYAETKLALMALYQQERERYVEAKGPVVWEILRRASQWSQSVGWRPGASDL
ncbi:GrpB family protein [Paenibacillus sp. HJGM_3]|uniref:GrpB family protein n=1 Tax=Paenibacillus sp. HJGM_3 TaxID=3379816 RepID=UPI00385CCB36